ncbi:MAG: preprotein translocase subunit SecA [Dehalococcoidia bacterium]
MLKGLLSVLTDSNDAKLKKLGPLVPRINTLEPDFERLSNQELRARTDVFKARLAHGESLDDLLPEAFAAVREAAKRTLGQRHFDVQLMGGIVLHQGKIAEMKTGEGKTLVATLPVFLNGLTGQGVHVVTVNDYLAKRDTVWMGPIYHLLGLSVGCLQHEAAYLYDPTAESENPSYRHLRPVPRREAYQADITYGTNNEFGFDYLRDNMALELSQKVQQELAYAIVDEVDNILIDEARTPLIISGPAEEPTRLYTQFAQLVPRLRAGEDYAVDEKHRTVGLTESGVEKLEGWLKLANLYAPENYSLVHYVENALRAHALFKRDKDYVLRNGEVVLVDEFTGRLMPGRRYSEGLHQAIEAKEGVKVQRETVTYATITIQNYFRMYGKLAGMTGTAATEAEELFKIYKLDVVVVPTNLPMIRQDFSDYIYKTEAAKWRAIVQEVEETYKSSRPVLVGTSSIEKNEHLSELLQRKGIPYEVLNAKQHEREAMIVAQAGRLGAVTVSTAMAGRGTDIILGGNPEGSLQEELRKQGYTLDTAPPELLDQLRQEVQARWREEHEKVVALGGLHVVGTEHHDARRVDNQLRGRSGRQGDPGSSRFYASLEDELLRRFGGDRIKGIMEWAGLDEDQPIENRMITKAVASAQTRVEGFHFEIRKHLLDYDDVVNRHREVIYNERNKILEGADLKANILDMIRRELTSLVDFHLGDRDAENWDLDGFLAEVKTIFPPPLELNGPDKLARYSRDEIQEQLIQHAEAFYAQREQEQGSEEMRTLERLLMLRTIDVHWVHHLTATENLRTGVGLQAYGQRDPLVVYKTEGHRMFEELLQRIQHDIVRTIYRVSLGPAPAQPQRRAAATPPASPMAAVTGNRRAEPVAVGAGKKVGRNDPCPCGSGKKYKKCHGASS